MCGEVGIALGLTASAGERPLPKGVKIGCEDAGSSVLIA